jgi:hypothetical protein
MVRDGERFNVERLRRLLLIVAVMQTAQPRLEMTVATGSDGLQRADD